MLKKVIVCTNSTSVKFWLISWQVRCLWSVRLRIDIEWTRKWLNAIASDVSLAPCDAANLAHVTCVYGWYRSNNKWLSRYGNSRRVSGNQSSYLPNKSSFPPLSAIVQGCLEWQVSFQGNCNATSVKKWNSKIHHQTRWYGSNFHREETTKRTFWALALRQSEWRSVHVLAKD